MPFAGFKDFDDCVRKNQDKRDPEAFCGFLKRKVEDKMKEQMPSEAPEGDGAHKHDETNPLGAHRHEALWDAVSDLQMQIDRIRSKIGMQERVYSNKLERLHNSIGKEQGPDLVDDREVGDQASDRVDLERKKEQKQKRQTYSIKLDDLTKKVFKEPTR